MSSLREVLHGAPCSRRAMVRIAAAAAVFAVGASAGCSTSPSRSGDISVMRMSGGIRGDVVESYMVYNDTLTASTRPLVVACLGDSLTYGQGSQDRSHFSWPSVLTGLLGSGYKVLNYGVPGAALIDGASLPYRQLGLVEDALSFAPSVTTVMFGTNDAHALWWSADAYEASLAQTVDQLQAAGSQVVLMVPPRPFGLDEGLGVTAWDSEAGFDANATIRDQVRGIMQNTARERGLGYVDIYALTSGRPEWYSDSVHLNATGYQAVAEEVYKRVWA